MALNDVITSIQNHTRNIYDALEDKNAIIPENKNLANVPDSIRSIEGNGLDTSDATAIAADIAKEKTAYVNGEKIEGTLLDLRRDTDATTFLGASENVSYTESTSNGWLRCTITPADPLIVNEHNLILAEISRSVAAREIGLTADKIVSGNTILGIEGTAISGDGNTNIKTFNSIEEMNNSTGNQTGDYALIYQYDKDINNLDFGHYITSWTFPKVVTLDSSITKDFFCSANTDEGDQDFTSVAASLSGNRTSISFYYKATGLNNVVEISQKYTSQDGKIFTSSKNDDFYVELPGTMSISIESNGDYDNQYLQIFKNIAYKNTEDRFANVYYYDETEWRLISLDTSDATATSNDIAQGKIAYVNGKEIIGGVETVNTSMSQGVADIIPTSGFLYFESTFYTPTLFAKGTKYSIQQPYANVANAINLTSDKIVEGNTVLGITGTATSGTNTGDATAAASDIMLGKTAYVKGQKITGTVTYRDYDNYFDDSNLKIELEQDSQRLDGEPYVSFYNHNMSGYIYNRVNFNKRYSEVAAAIGLTADKIVSGNTILGIAGTATEGLDTSDATAIDNDILAGKTAYVNGELVTGTLVDRSNRGCGYQGGITIKEDGNLFTMQEVVSTAYREIFHNTIVSFTADVEDVAEAIGLTADKIAQGNTILGITGGAAVFSEYAPRYISFQGYTGTGLKSELDALNTSNIEDMSEMFKDCSNITELDLNNFDTSKVTDMSNMFSGCSNLEILDISSFDVSNVSTATDMFDSIPSDCIIWVKDEATREWVLSIRSDLTNVLVTGEALPSATNPTLTSVNKEYDGTALTIAVAGGSGGTIYYRTSEDNDTWSAWATTKPTRTAIGVTYVQAYVKGDSTHSDTLPTESATITIKEVPKTSIAVPTAKTNLKYTGSAQTGVAAGTGYTLSGTTSATNAGSYTAYATPNLNYIWSDGTSDKKTITWSIGKATPTISIDQGWAPDVYIGSSETLGIKPSVSGTWTISSSSTALSLTSKPTSATAGSYSYLTYKGVSEKSSVTITVTLNPSNTTNYNSVTETYKVSVDGIYPDDLTVVTTGRTTYTPNEIGGSSFKLDGYTFRVDYNNGTSKNVSSSQCTYGYLWAPGKSSVPVTVYYEENGETVTTSVTITINPSS